MGASIESRAPVGPGGASGMTPGESIEALRRAAASGDERRLAELGVAVLNAGSPDDAQRADALEVLEDYASGTGSAMVQCLIGSYLLHLYKRPGHVERALEWLEAAAEQGAPLALQRLAGVYVGGEFVEPDPARALAWLARLADAGFQKQAWEQGWLLSCRGRAAEAAAAFARACALGYPPAFFALGVRFVEGRGVARDAAFGAALVRRAVDAKYPGAAEYLNRHLPGGIDRDRAADWYRRLVESARRVDPAVVARLQRGLESVAQVDRSGVLELERHFQRIGHPALAFDPDTGLTIAGAGRSDPPPSLPDWHWLCRAPRIATFPDFISLEERAQVLFLAGGGMQRPEARAEDCGNNQFEPRLFDGSMHQFEPSEGDVVIAGIKQRIAAQLDVEPSRIEPLSVIRYGAGHEYRAHVDYFDPEALRGQAAEGGEADGQRVATFLICLNPALAGGETCYDRVGVRIAHALCMAAVHYNVDEQGAPVLDSLHRSNAVERGEKWLLRTAVRETAF